VPDETTEQRYRRYHKEHFAKFEEIQKQIAKLATTEDLNTVGERDRAFRTWFYRGLIVVLAGAVLTTAGGLIGAWRLGAAYEKDKTAMQHQIDHLQSVLHEDEGETP